jgi:hypothetical protein
VRDMGEVSSPLMNLRPVTFRYKNQEGGVHFGLIAEEVEQVMPELAVRGADGQIETVAYHEMPALLLNELQKQRDIIAHLGETNASQDKTIVRQNTHIEVLQKEMENLKNEMEALKTLLKK